MMPNCQHRRCKRVATTNLGKIIIPEDIGPKGTWEQTTYVCDKHYEKILKELSYGFLLKEKK